MSSAKKVVLIRPPMLIPRYSFTGLTVPPLGLAYVAAAVRQEGHRLILIDAVGEAIETYSPLYDDYIVHGLSTEQILDRIPPEADYIGVSCMFSHESLVYRNLIQAVKERFPRIPIMAGGEHITALSEESLEKYAGLDLVVLGEGDETICDVVAGGCSDEELSRVPGVAWRDRGGHFRTSGPRARVREIDSFPRPAWDLVPLENYWKYGMGLGVDRGRSMPMLATRGCPYQCTFCSNPAMWTTRWIARKPQEVLAEMRHYVEKYKAVNFDFYDLTAIVNRQWIVEFCNAVIDSGLKFSYQLPSGTRSEAIDDEVAGLLYRSGCRNMTYAPESGSPDTLTRIKKRIKVDRVLDSMRSCRKENLNVKANIIVGFPGETVADLFRTYGFILRMAVAGVFDVTIQPFSAYPGSELFNDLRREGRIAALDDEYFLALANYSDLSKAVSWSKNLSAGALLRFRTLGMLSFYAVSYALRPWRFVKVVSNLLHKKQESRIERALSDIFQRKSVLARDLASKSRLATAAQAVARPPYI
ncbi:MAG: B12-binding domain-containing radical SAM protein [Elusimicrobiota bacterium]